MTAHQEIELKLRLTSKSLGIIRKSSWWKGLGRARRRTLSSVYFDTPEGLLRSNAISFRLRYDGKSTVQTLKAADQGVASIVRREWEVLLSNSLSSVSGPAISTPDLCAMKGEGLPLVVQNLNGEDLEPVLEVRVERSTKETKLADFGVEYAVDQGEVRAGGHIASIREIELELLNGDAAGLFSNARQLNEIAPTRLHLRTKSETGLLLCQQPLPVWFKKPRIELTRSMTGGDALRALAHGCLRHLTINDECALSNSHEEGVHQCRVAFRRLRSVLKFYRRDLPVDVVGRLDGQARWLLGELGPARDLLVFRTQLLHPIIASMKDTENLKLLREAVLARETLSQSRVQRALSSNRYGRFLIDLAELSFLGVADEAIARQQRYRLAQPVADYASQTLSRLDRKLKKRGRNFETLSLDERHDVRIAVKRLRYCVDFFKSLFPKSARRGYSLRLAGLQDKLGILNDIAVAQSLVKELTNNDNPDPAQATALSNSTERELFVAAGIVLGWQMQRANEIEKCLIRDWSTFARMAPYWNDPV